VRIECKGERPQEVCAEALGVRIECKGERPQEVCAEALGVRNVTGDLRHVHCVGVFQSRELGREEEHEQHYGPEGQYENPQSEPEFILRSCQAESGRPHLTSAFRNVRLGKRLLRAIHKRLDGRVIVGQHRYILCRKRLALKTLHPLQEVRQLYDFPPHEAFSFCQHGFP